MRFLRALLMLMAMAAAALVWWDMQRQDGSRNVTPLSERLEKPADGVASADQDAKKPLDTASSQIRLEPARRNIRNVTPEEFSLLPQEQGDYVERLPALVKERPKRTRPVDWPKIEVRSAGVLRSGKTDIAIAGIEPLAAEANCRSEDGSQWPCGNFARAALNRLIRGRTVRCDPVDGNDGGVVTRCGIGGHDIALWLVQQGWARPGADAAPPLVEAYQQAQAEHRGQWR